MKLPERNAHAAAREEKVTDKALTRSIVISVIGILSCMVCLFGLTWAWFSSSVTTAANVVTAATFDLDITVQSAEDTVLPEGNCYLLDPGTTYTVSLSKRGTAKTGFCLLSVKTPNSENPTAFYTDNIPQTDPATQQETERYVFTVSGVSQITFTPMWGQCPQDQPGSIVKYGTPLSFDTVPVASAETKTDEIESADAVTEEKPETAELSTEPPQTTPLPETADAPGAETPAQTEPTQTEPTDSDGQSMP